MSKKKLFIILYILFVGVLYLASSTLARYVSKEQTKGEFTIGQKLYFEYERGDLFRNNELIVGVPVEDVETDSDGNIISTSRRIETMNVAPGDDLVYHFYVSNLNEKTAEYNGVEGIFHVSASAVLSMPVHQSNYELSCTITYREIPTDGSNPGVFKDFTQDTNLDLEVSDGTIEKKYEFQVFVILDDQVKATSNDDYIGATLSIYLFVDAANKITN